MRYVHKQSPQKENSNQLAWTVPIVALTPDAHRSQVTEEADKIKNNHQKKRALRPPELKWQDEQQNYINKPINRMRKTNPPAKHTTSKWEIL